MIGQKNTYDRINPKTIWLNVGLIVMVVGLSVAQVVISSNNSTLQPASASNTTSPTETNPDDNNQEEYKNIDIQIRNIRQTRDNLSIDYSLVNLDPESGKAFVGFYFDKYDGSDQANIYYGTSPFVLPSQYVPVGFKRLCSAIFLPNLERLAKTETCEEFITSQ